MSEVEVKHVRVDGGSEHPRDADPAAPAVEGERAGGAPDISVERLTTLLLGLQRGAGGSQPDGAESLRRVIESASPALIAARADAERRRTGMWAGAAMTWVFVAAAVLTAYRGQTASFVPAVLLCLAAASAGATFALIAGRRTRADEAPVEPPEDERP